MPSVGEHGFAATLLQHVVKGDYASALRFAASRSVLPTDNACAVAGPPPQDNALPFDSTAAVIYFQNIRLHASAAAAAEHGSSCDHLSELLLVAAAALLVFLQANLTG